MAIRAIKEEFMDVSSVKVFKEKQEKQSSKRESSISILNKHLFDSLERLSNLDINNENAAKEIERAEAITKTAHSVIEVGQLTLNYQKYLYDNGMEGTVEMPLIGMTDDALIEENLNLKKRMKKAEQW